MVSFGDVLAAVADTNVVVGVCWPYLFQARAMLRNREVSFSPHASFVILFSATVRVYYWIGARYGTALFLQAIVSVLTQLGMLYVVTKIRKQIAAQSVAVAEGAAAPRRRPVAKHITDMNLAHFWNWDDWSDYLTFQLVLLMFMSVMTLVLDGSPAYYEALGYVALGVEATLPGVQIIQNYQRKSTHGLSLVLIITWFAGDAFKTIYAIAKAEPLQFTLCGLVQLLCDCVILAQMACIYKQPKTRHRPHADTDEAVVPGEPDVDDGTTELTRLKEGSEGAGAAEAGAGSAGPVSRWLEHARMEAEAESEHMKHRHVGRGVSPRISTAGAGVSGGSGAGTAVVSGGSAFSTGAGGSVHRGSGPVTATSSAASRYEQLAASSTEASSGGAASRGKSASPSPSPTATATAASTAAATAAAAAAVKAGSLLPAASSSTGSESGRSSSRSRKAAARV